MALHKTVGFLLVYQCIGKPVENQPFYEEHQLMEYDPKPEFKSNFQ